MTFLEYIISWLQSLFSGRTTTRVPSDEETSTTPAPSPMPASGGRHLITEPERVTAHFHDTGSPAWKNQWPGTPMAGQHGGTDFSAPHGSPVYAPYPMRVIVVNYYADPGRMGWYVIGILDDGIEYYSGHLQNIKVTPASKVEAGAILGETNVYNHTHIQMKRRGQIIDPETYLAGH